MPVGNVGIVGNLFSTFSTFSIGIFVFRIPVHPRRFRTKTHLLLPSRTQWIKKFHSADIGPLGPRAHGSGSGNGLIKKIAVELHSLHQRDRDKKNLRVLFAEQSNS